MENKYLEKIKKDFLAQSLLLRSWLNDFYGSVDFYYKGYNTEDNTVVIYVYDLNRPVDDRKYWKQIPWKIYKNNHWIPEEGILIFPTEEDREMFMEFLEESINLWKMNYLLIKHSSLLPPHDLNEVFSDTLLNRKTF